jgi:hypothetical protein
VDSERANLTPVRAKAWQLILKGTRRPSSEDFDDRWIWAMRNIRQGETGHDSRQRVRKVLQPQLTVTNAYSRHRGEGVDEGSETLGQLLRIDFASANDPPPSEILQAWPERLEQELALFRVLERALVEALEEASEVGFLEGWDRASGDVPSVARHAQNAHHRGFYPITRTVADLWDRISLRDRELARTLVNAWSSSQYLLVRRLHLYAQCSETTFTPQEAFSALETLDDGMFWDSNAQVEIMRLATKRWQEFRESDRQLFESRVRLGISRHLFPADAFEDEERWISVRDSSVMKRLARIKSMGGPLSPESLAVLDEIAGRHPKWVASAGDRDDFAIWHQSRQGPDGHPERLAHLADDVLAGIMQRFDTRPAQGADFA